MIFVYTELEQIFRLYCAQFHSQILCLIMKWTVRLSFTQMTSARVEFDLNIFELHSGLYIYFLLTYPLFTY